MVVFSSRLAPPLVPCSHHPNWIPQLQVSHLRRHISSRACILLVSFDVQSCFLPCIGGHCSAYLWRCCCSSELILQFSSINLSFGIHIPKKGYLFMVQVSFIEDPCYLRDVESIRVWCSKEMSTLK